MVVLFASLLVMAATMALQASAQLGAPSSDRQGTSIAPRVTTPPAPCADLMKCRPVSWTNST
jgi:hypothetical protein